MDKPLTYGEHSMHFERTDTLVKAIMRTIFFSLSTTQNDVAFLRHDLHGDICRGGRRTKKKL